MAFDDVKRGMGLDEVLQYDARPETYSALRSEVMNDVERELNLDIPSELTDLFNQLQTNNSGAEQEQTIVEAILAKLNDLKTSLKNVVDSDLEAQQAVRDEIATRDTLDQLVPFDIGEELPDELAKVIDLVAAPALREVTGI